MASKEQGATSATASPIPVRALTVGFYGGCRRRRGDAFTITSEAELGSWMERRDTPTAKALDAAEQARTDEAEKFAR